MITINIAKEFSPYPGGRYERFGKFSGEEFRDKLLLPAIEEGPVTVELDGVRGYGSSFLEEAFGGLVRAMRWRSRADVNDRLFLVTTRPSVRREIDQYIDDQLRAPADATR